MTTPWHNDRASRISLDGAWAFSLNGQSGSLHVPGCWEAQGYDRHAEGPAILQRTVVIPSDWRGQTVQIQFDAVSYYVEAEMNGISVGTHTGSWSPFAFDVTAALRPGEDNTIRLTIYKTGERFAVRESLAGFLPDVALMFGGVWQSARLVAFPGPALSDIKIISDGLSGTVMITACLVQSNPASVELRIYDQSGAVVVSSTVPGANAELTASLTVPEPKRWRPSDPSRYILEITVEDSGRRTLAQVRRPFGFRALASDGEQLLLNGEPVCLRGVLNWGWYPDILCPAPDEATIRDEFRRVRELGFNMVKLCLLVPSPLYFDIADQEGMLLWLELPMWLPEMTPRLAQQAPLEYADMMQAVHHHPSTVIYSLGCELASNVGADLLAQLNAIVRGYARGALVCDNSGSGEAYGGLSFDFADFNDYHFYCDLHYFEPLVDHFSRDWRPPRPWIFGEFCDADDYRDMAEISALYGGHLPWWLVEQNPIRPASPPAYPEQTQRMQAHDPGLDDQALLRLSRQQSLVVRKTILEKVRARAGMGGYVVTGLRDTPLATSSVFDDLNRVKYDPAVFRDFNADTILLLGQGRSRVWYRGGDRPAPFAPYTFLAGQDVQYSVILAHTGPPLPAARATLHWRIVLPGGEVLARGEQPVEGPFAGGRPRTIGVLSFRTPPGETAVALRLEVAFEANDRQFHNAWTLWVFPEITEWPDGIGMVDPAGCLTGLDDLWDKARTIEPRSASLVLASTLTEGVLEFLQDDGGLVLLLQTGGGPLPAIPCPFWRESIKILGDHPAIQAMPHAGFVDLQFYGLATDWALDTSRLNRVLPTEGNVRPLLRRLDARQFTLADYLVEVEVGAGRLIASTLRFQGGAGDQPASFRFQPAGRWLLYHLIKTLLP